MLRVIAALVLIAAVPATTAFAQVSKQKEQTRKLDPKALELPDSAHGRTPNLKTRKNDAPAGISMPNRVDLGAYDLEFRAGSTRDVNRRDGFDSGEISNIDKIRPRSESAKPDYFGLKLTSPTK